MLFLKKELYEHSSTKKLSLNKKKLKLVPTTLRVLMYLNCIKSNDNFKVVYKTNKKLKKSKV